ncbi:MAG: DUF1638 domain-containing protein [Desulfobaccales bacterium]
MAINRLNSMGGLESEETAVLACRVFEPELTSLGVPPRRVLYLEQGLHRFPDRLRQELSAALKKLERKKKVRRILLVYGYCGGGLEGLRTQRVEIVLPLAHDCVPILLGREMAGPQEGLRGTFYLSPGWIDHGQTPYSEYFLDRERFGPENALWVGQRMLAGYHEVVLVDTGTGLRPHHRRYARGMARLFGLSYREVRGCRSWFRLLFRGEGGPQVLLVSPGRVLERRHYP